MDRRTFLAASGAATLAPAAGLAFAAEATAGRQLIELQQYQLETDEQKKLFDRYMAAAAVPALNRAGVKPVGVFFPQEGIGPAYVVLPHPTCESFVTTTQKLLADKEYLARGAELLDAPAAIPAFKRLESSLTLAFKGMPQLETPARGPGRVVQLRIYESPSVKTGQKKIEMFNDAGEIAIFRRVGLAPVFFGETLIGPKMPNLTYMLAFESLEAQKAAWDKFRSDPAWLKLRALPEYKDDAILVKGGITNLLLKPAAYSQI
jgi:hypothetical protein